MSSKVKFLSRAKRKRLLEALSQVEEGTPEAKAIREQLGAHAPLDPIEEAKKKAEAEAAAKAAQEAAKKAQEEAKKKAAAEAKKKTAAKKKTEPIETDQFKPKKTRNTKKKAASSEE